MKGEEHLERGAAGQLEGSEGPGLSGFHLVQKRRGRGLGEHAGSDSWRRRSQWCFRAAGRLQAQFTMLNV